MSYYNRYRNKKRAAGGDGGGGGGGSTGNGAGDRSYGVGNIANGGLGVPDAVFDLGKNKRVTVRQFRNVNLIDIREYYMDNATGEMRPGKKGISLTEDLYDGLLKHRLNIDEALRRLGSRRPRTKTVVLESDEDDDDNDNDDNDSTSGKKTKKKKQKLSDEPEKKRKTKSDKKEPAPPTLLLKEETIQNAEREANAALIVPGIKNQIPAKKKEEEDQDPRQTENSSDEEFAQHLNAEMNKADDEVSEEE